MRISKVSGASIAMAAAVALLSNGIAPQSAEAAHKGHCVGANSCKGHGSCKTASNACKGKNACKGTSFMSMSKAKCAKHAGAHYEKG